jgi:hypothetical protein
MVETHLKTMEISQLYDTQSTLTCCHHRPQQQQQQQQQQTANMYAWPFAQYFGQQTAFIIAK